MRRRRKCPRLWDVRLREGPPSSAAGSGAQRNPPSAARSGGPVPSFVGHWMWRPAPFSAGVHGLSLSARLRRTGGSVLTSTGWIESDSHMCMSQCLGAP
ncbi:hypothetical protein E2562_036617 [Oryza meyeriana var. granulata]|uniref:Uncharacterized protein n=1 Tax=Oryza meyeriana var. granulata TaxID=110450 RepID=A0A6G1BPX0_9ORYZ|nr:hypothetical protein E2562_036617 [Oryza meyeriana var. granulata]